MPRSKNRARNRVAKRERRYRKACAAFEESRGNVEAFCAVVRHLVDSDLLVWVVAKLAAQKKPLDDTERAIISEFVNASLAGLTPGEVYRRQVFLHSTRVRMGT